MQRGTKNIRGGARSVWRALGVLRARCALLSVCAAAAFLSPEEGRAAEPASRELHIAAFAQQWLGTPYLWGGTTNRGIDCSAYARQMYRELFRLELPRTTRGQIRVGVPIAVNPKDLESSLAPGDVVFFIDRKGWPTHIVVYMGRGQYARSTGGRGVVVGPLLQLAGRRIVARRYLVPRDGRKAEPDGDASDVAEIPCPPVTPEASEVARYASEPVTDLEAFKGREICELRGLAAALYGADGPNGKKNARKLHAYAQWLEGIEAVGGKRQRDTKRAGRRAPRSEERN